MEICTKENGKMERLMDMEFLLILMDQCMSDSGRMINNMDMELNLGIIIK
jgi:hypothetical protein